MSASPTVATSLVLSSVWLAAACGASPAPATNAPASAPPPTAAPATTTPPSGPAPTATGAQDDTGLAARPSVSAALLPPAVSHPSTPKPVEPVHGGQYWTVFLALGADGPEMTRQTEAWRAKAEATKLPLSSGEGCHQGEGAPGENEKYVSVYFKTEAQAKKFAEGVQPPPVKVVPLKVFCLD
jgi:hypothetical protein